MHPPPFSPPRPGLSRLDAGGFDARPEPLLVLDAHLAVLAANRAFATAFGDVAAGRPLHALGDALWHDPVLLDGLGAVLTAGSVFEGHTGTLTTVAGDARTVRVSARRLPADAGAGALLLRVEEAPVPHPPPVAEDVFESIVATVREPLLVLDEELRVVLANRAFLRTFCVSEAETVGQHVYALGNGQWNVPSLRQLFEDILPHNTHFDDIEVVHTFERIGRRTMLLNARKVYRSDPYSRLILLAIEDVTERRSMENALLLRSQELEEFAYIVSHDLKSPLVTITGRIAMLKRYLDADDETRVRHAVERIELSADRMGRLVEDLLQLSRIGRVRGQTVVVDVEALVEGLWEGVALRLGATPCRFEVQPDLPPVRADAQRLTEVFENLLANAARYGCGGGATQVRVGATVENGELCYYVADDGPGIAPAYHQKVFGLFQRLVSDQEGTGVGLAIVAKIMRAHDGRAWVTSQEGAGATFWLAFPLAALPSATDSPPDAP